MRLDGGEDCGAFLVGAVVLSYPVMVIAEHAHVQWLVGQCRVFIQADDVVHREVGVPAPWDLAERAELAQAGSSVAST